MNIKFIIEKTRLKLKHINECLNNKIHYTIT